MKRPTDTGEDHLQQTIFYTKPQLFPAICVQIKKFVLSLQHSHAESLFVELEQGNIT